MSGTGEYVAAVRGRLKVEIDSGSLDYGSDILRGHHDPGAVALRITLEAARDG